MFVAEITPFVDFSIPLNPVNVSPANVGESVVPTLCALEPILGVIM